MRLATPITHAKLPGMHYRWLVESVSKQLDVVAMTGSTSVRGYRPQSTMGNTGSTYVAIKEATGPCATKNVPLKSKSGESITDQ